MSAASSVAIAKLKGCARATNDPAYVPLASSHCAAVAPASRPGRDLSRRTRRSRCRVGGTAGPSAQGRRIDHGGRRCTHDLLGEYGRGASPALPAPYVPSPSRLALTVGRYVAAASDCLQSPSPTTLWQANDDRVTQGKVWNGSDGATVLTHVGRKPRPVLQRWLRPCFQDAQTGPNRLSGLRCRCLHVTSHVINGGNLTRRWRLDG